MIQSNEMMVTISVEMVEMSYELLSIEVTEQSTTITQKSETMVTITVMMVEIHYELSSSVVMK